MKLLVVHLTELRELLQPGSVLLPHRKGAKELEKEVEDERRAATGEPRERVMQNSASLLNFAPMRVLLRPLPPSSGVVPSAMPCDGKAGRLNPAAGRRVIIGL